MTVADEIRRRHRPGFDLRHLGRSRQCVRCHTPWPCDVVYVLELVEAEVEERIDDAVRESEAGEDL